MTTNFNDFLTPKQQLFCDEYLTDMNASRAALMAGYSAATALNGQLMRMPKIKLYLQQRIDDTSKRLATSHDRLLQELSKVAFGNMANFINPDGTIKPLNEISADDMAAVQSMTIAPDGTVKVRLCSKMAALDRIAKHLNFYKPTDAMPEKTHVYLDKQALTDDDTFDDEELKQEKKREEKKLRKAEEKRLKAENAQQIPDDEPCESEEPTCEENDAMLTPDEAPVIYDGAGIAYERDDVVNCEAPVAEVKEVAVIEKTPEEIERELVKAHYDKYPVKPAPFLLGRYLKQGNTFGGYRL